MRQVGVIAALCVVSAAAGGCAQADRAWIAAGSASLPCERLTQSDECLSARRPPTEEDRARAEREARGDDFANRYHRPRTEPPKSP